jgi:tetratricopeptide (TPR) repeat protein
MLSLLHGLVFLIQAAKFTFVNSASVMIAANAKVGADPLRGGLSLLVKEQKKGPEESDNNDLRAMVAQSAGGRELFAAAEHLVDGQIGEAETICRKALKRDPFNVDAMCLLGDIGIRMGMLADAENLLSRCLELAPDFHQARGHYANLLFKKQHYDAALFQLDLLAKALPAHHAHMVLRANIYIRVGRNDDALAVYRNVAAVQPDSVPLQMSLGHTLKTLGHQAEAIDAYRLAAHLDPSHGDAFWSLANLKTYRFDEADINAMRLAAQSEEIDRENFLHLCFALGKALEDRGDYDEAFSHYRRGNAVRRRSVPYNADVNHQEMQALQDFFTDEQITRSAGSGNPDPAPIFILGLPRAGSTLIEQILASHSLVEGTQELPDIISMARRLAGNSKGDANTAYPDILAEMSPSQLRALGDEYLERTRVHRTGTPYFIDKMPNNFAHIGMIHLILPNATIIDARRNPMDCCFSNYKQLFAQGQNFTYSLSDIGRYYVDYLALMRHWDRVLPGRVIRIINEELIVDPEIQIRRLLDSCGLPFEQACLEFHKNNRAVRTASSEQVRQPVNASGVDRWRKFEPHLESLKLPLGSAMDEYRR